MASVSKLYRYKKTDVYPRVHYFQRTLESLLARFKVVIGNFDEFYQDRKRMEDIEKVVKSLLRHPCMFILSETEQFHISRTAALKTAFSNLVYIDMATTELSTDDLVMTAFVYYYKVADSGQSSQQFTDLLAKRVEELSVIASTSQGTSQGTTDLRQSEHVIRPDTSVSSKLIVAVDVPIDKTGDGDIDATLQAQITDDISKLYDESFVRERLKVGESVDIGCLLSADLESRVFVGFDNIDNYLREHRKLDQSCYKVSKTLTEDQRISEFLRTSFSNIYSLSLVMKDLCAIRGVGELDDKVVFRSTLVVFIAFGLKSIVTQALFERFSLSQTLVHLCLERIDFMGKVQASLTDDSCLSLQVFDSIYNAVNEETTVTGDLKQDRIKDSELIDSFLKGLEDVFAELEKEVIDVNKNVEIVKKMNFEISGYYKRTATREDRPIPKATTSKELQTELFRCKDVIGCGFIYGIFEILVREDNTDEAIDDTVKAIMNNHRYIGQYTIKRVSLNKSRFMP